jgi:flagellar assembly protein FliH
MPAPLRLEVFESVSLTDEPALLMPDQIEDLRLTAYERGYVAGWDDAQSQAAADRGARAALVAARIEALTFGYHEARAHVLGGLMPLFEAMLTHLLPAAARAAILPMVVEELMALAQNQADRPLTLRVPTGWRADYQAALAGLALPPLTLAETDDLAETEAEIVSDGGETRIDLTAAMARIAAAFAAFTPAPEQEAYRA